MFPNARKFYLLCFLFSFLGASCATAPTVQPQVNSLVIAQRPDRALKVLDQHPEAYGKNNELLYLLDRGLILHILGQYPESISIFEKAKATYAQLYTESVTRLSGSWLWNDYLLPYRGEDFERVLINTFQILNFARLGNYVEALVEARDADSTLSAIQTQYPAEQKSVYRDDAFVRFLSGILYEAQGLSTASAKDFNDAFIAYEKAYEVYAADYRKHYGFDQPPRLLKENLLTMAGFMGGGEYAKYRERFSDISVTKLADKRKKGEVYLIQYEGLSPTKVSDEIVIPLGDGHIAKWAFPRYKKRIYESRVSCFSAQSKDKKDFFTDTELVEDIEALAVKNLEDRKVRMILKSVGRSGLKYLLQTSGERSIEKARGETAGRLARYAGDLLQVFSEKADVRSWQTLPAKIRMARLLLDPGEYVLFLDGKNVAQVQLQKGEKRFFIVRAIDPGH